MATHTVKIALLLILTLFGTMIYASLFPPLLPQQKKSVTLHVAGLIKG